MNGAPSLPVFAPVEELPDSHPNRVRPTRAHLGGEDCPTKPQVGAPIRQRLGDYNRNSKHARQRPWFRQGAGEG